MTLRKKDSVGSWIMLIAGACIAAFALEEFLAPNNIFDGGVTGISMIVSNLLKANLGIPLSLGVLVILINIPFIILGFRRLGKRFILKTIVAVAVFSVMTGVFEKLANATSDTILAAVFGGVFLGIGVGLVLRGGGVLDGTEIVAIILNKKISISIGTIILIFNVAIYTVAGFLFGLDRGMYSLLMYFITSKVIDIVEMGWDNTKSVMIITDNGRELANLIYQELGRTVTFLEGRGLVSRDSKDVLYCVVTRAEIFDLKQIISKVEGSTFTTISDVSEVVGNHIKSRDADL